MSDEKPTRQWRFQFGLRGLLVVMTLVALATAWIGYLHRQAQNRTKLTAELVSSGILVDLEEPNWLGQLAKKLVPQREPWLRQQLGRGWLGYPTVFCTWEMNEQQVSATADRLRRLGTVREFQFRREPPEAVAAAMRRELPGVDVLTTTIAIRTYYQRRVSQPVFAFEGAGFLALLAAGLIGTAGWIVWKVRHASVGKPQRAHTSPTEDVTTSPPVPPPAACGFRPERCRR